MPEYPGLAARDHKYEFVTQVVFSGDNRASGSRSDLGIDEMSVVSTRILFRIQLHIVTAPCNTQLFSAGLDGDHMLASCWGGKMRPS